MLEYLITTLLSIYDAFRDTISNGAWSTIEGERREEIFVKGLKG